MTTLTKFLMPGGRFGSHQVLIFHRILDKQDPMSPDEPTVTWFDELIAYLASNFTIIPLADAIQLAANKRLPKASLSITFDDGYADNLTLALPVLEKHKAHATFFIASGFLNGGRMWNDSIIETARLLPAQTYHLPYCDHEVIHLESFGSRRILAEHIIQHCKYLPIDERDEQVALFTNDILDQLPQNLMMTTEQVLCMAQSQYAEIGGHTRNHPILARCSNTQAEQEITDGLNDLEAITGTRPRLFAYPNGALDKDYTLEQSRILKKLGIVGAVSTDWGKMSVKTDALQIPRFTPWAIDKKRFVIDLLRARYGLL